MEGEFTNETPLGEGAFGTNWKNQVGEMLGGSYKLVGRDFVFGCFWVGHLKETKRFFFFQGMI